MEAPERSASQTAVDNGAVEVPTLQSVSANVESDLFDDSDIPQQRTVVYDFQELQMESGRNGELVNIVEGLELWTDVLAEAEQTYLIEQINQWEDQGVRGLLKGRTFAAPKKWIRGKGRRTIQFGCCYNYAPDREGRPAGIVVDEIVEDMPAPLTALSDRLVRWGIIPCECCPDSAIVNIYAEGDCIPPHVDNMQFLRPFVTISLLSDAVMKFGLRLTPTDPGEFSGPFGIRLPVGSCLVVDGNAANLAKHCVPAVRQRRLSITLRKMDPRFVEQINVQKQHLAATADHSPQPDP